MKAKEFFYRNGPTYRHKNTVCFTESGVIKFAEEYAQSRLPKEGEEVWIETDEIIKGCQWFKYEERIFCKAITTLSLPTEEEIREIIFIHVGVAADTKKEADKPVYKAAQEILTLLKEKR